ncbi:hypothetical protein XPN_1908 [Xanthomonas arboricola pv. pruni MAFF 301427]|nr:hypothetical protein XPN_1908 [Xanthomonas arboricola pv. pruni MAFF 301427]
MSADRQRRKGAASVTFDTRPPVAAVATMRNASTTAARPMRIFLWLALLPAVASPHARAQQTDKHDAPRHRAQVSSQQCGLGTSFNVLADDGGIWLYRDSDWPREIFFHGGELSIDHKLQQTSTADARRLWEMEQRTRALMPQVAGIAYQVIDLSYDALGGVIEVMTGSALNARKIERLRKRARAYVDGTPGQGALGAEGLRRQLRKLRRTRSRAIQGQHRAPHALADRHRAFGRNRQTRPTDGRPTGCKAGRPGVHHRGQRQRAVHPGAGTASVTGRARVPLPGKRLQLLAPLQDDTPRHDAEHAEPNSDTGDAPPNRAVKLQPATNS